MESAQVVTLLMAAGGGMATAIALLFKTVMETNKKHTDLSVEVGELRGKNEGIQNLSAEVLETVHRAVSKNNKPQ